MRFLTVILFCIALQATSYSQCCSSGCCSPGTANFGVLEKGHLFAFGFYKYNYSDHFYKGDSPYDLRYYKNIYFSYGGINLSYGITDKLTIQGDIGYFINKTQNYYFNDYQLQGNGIGDAGLYLKYNFFSGPVWNLTLGIGGKIPTGEFNQYVNGVRLPLEVQSGTGAYATTFMANIMVKPFPNKQRSFIINSRTDYNSISPVGYQFGISNTNTLSYTFPLGKSFAFMAMVRNEIKTTDYNYNVAALNPDPSARFNPLNGSGFSNRQEQQNTGCYRFFASPGITWSPGKEWNLSAFGDFPVYQYYTGIQFAAKYALSFSVSKMIGLHKESK
jgi:hypothetical protein